MFIAQHTGNHSSGAPNSRDTARIANMPCQRGRSSALGHRGGLHSRVPQVRCNSSHSNNVAHLRVSAAMASAQLACEQSCVQDLLAQVVQTTRGKQQLQQSQPVLRHAVEIHRQQLNGHFSTLKDKLQLGSSVEAVAAPLEDHQHLQQEQRHELQQHQHQQQEQPTQLPWLLVPQQHQHALQLDNHVMQRVQQHPVQCAEQLGAGSLQELAYNHGHGWQQRRRQEQQQCTETEQLEGLDKRADLLLQECSAVLDAPIRQQGSSNKPKHPPLSWRKCETIQGWKYSQQDMIARTPAGIAVLRLSTGTQVCRQAKQLLSWLRREQQVILSVAGAGLAHAALECLAQLQQLSQQHYPQYQLTVTANFHSSSRPRARGRCQVYHLACSLQDKTQPGVAQVQIAGQQLRQRPQQQHKQHLDSSCSSSYGVGPSGDLQHELHQCQGTAVHPGQLHWQYAGIGLDAPLQHGLPVTAVAGVTGPSVCRHQPAAFESGKAGLGQQLQLPACRVASTIPQSQHTAACQGVSQHSSKQCQHQQQSAQHTLRQQGAEHWQQQRQRRWQEPHQQQHQGPLTGDVQQVEAKGTAISIADSCAAALQHSVAVSVPIAYAKQAVKLLEAAAVLERRCKQASAANDASTQVKLQVIPGLVHRQSGSNKRGVHVLLSAAPLVQY